MNLLSIFCLFLHRNGNALLAFTIQRNIITSHLNRKCFINIEELQISLKGHPFIYSFSHQIFPLKAYRNVNDVKLYILHGYTNVYKSANINYMYNEIVLNKE